MKRRKAIKSFLLLGAGVAATYSGITIYKWNRKPDFEFLDANLTLINEMADTVIPTTDTPGAKDADVAPTLVHMIKSSCTRVEQNVFINGMKELISFSSSHFGKPFPELSSGDKKIALQQFKSFGDNARSFVGKARNKIIGRSFYNILCNYTVIAYCTSEKGATQGLRYDYIPGRFEACVKISGSTKAWATK